MRVGNARAETRDERDLTRRCLLPFPGLAEQIDQGVRLLKLLNVSGSDGRTDVRKVANTMVSAPTEEVGDAQMLALVNANGRRGLARNEHHGDGTHRGARRG